MSGGLLPIGADGAHLLFDVGRAVSALGAHDAGHDERAPGAPVDTDDLPGPSASGPRLNFDLDDLAPLDEAAARKRPEAHPVAG
jgi:hypothetical protein